MKSKKISEKLQGTKLSRKEKPDFSGVFPLFYVNFDGSLVYDNDSTISIIAKDWYKGNKGK